MTEEVSVTRSDETDSHPERQGRRDVGGIIYYEILVTSCYAGVTQGFLIC